MEAFRSSKAYLYLRGEEGGEHRIGFLDIDFAHTRKIVLKEWVTVTIILCTAVLAILSLFWGAFLYVEENLDRIKVFVVNFDREPSGVVGTTIVQYARTLPENPQPQLGWEVLPSEVFNHDPLNVRSAVYDFEAWAAISILPHASSALRHAVETGDAHYNPSAAVEIVYVGARDTFAMPNYVLPALEEFARNATSLVGEAWVTAVLQNTTIPIRNLLAAPQAVNPAIGFTTLNLRPIYPPQVIPALTVAASYLIVISFFSYAFFLPTHTHFVNEMEGHGRLYFYQLVIWKYFSAVWAYFFLSLCYSLVSLAFQVPFSNSPVPPTEAAMNPNAYGTATFVVYWMVNWLGMIALGLASEIMAMFLGQPWSALWLVFWIVSNVCTALYPIELAPRVYSYGYAFPLHNIIEASKQIFFNLYPQIGLNVGVLLAWWAVNTLVFPFGAWFFRYKTLKKMAKQRSQSS